MGRNVDDVAPPPVTAARKRVRGQAVRIGLRPRVPRTDAVVALALFAAGLLVLAPGIGWGLPYATAAGRVSPWGSDELAPLGPLAQILRVVFRGGAEFDPRYPLLPYLVMGTFEAPYLVWLKLTGGLGQLSTTFPFGLADPVHSLATLTLFARLPSLLAAAALPVVMFRIATVLRDRRTGVVAGALVLGVYPIAYYGRTSNVDAMAVFWGALGLFVFAVCLRDRLTVRRAAALGVFAALATATKDQYYALFVGIGAVLLVRHLMLARRERWQRKATLAPIVAGFMAGLVVYLIASGLAVNPDRFMAHVRFVGGSTHADYNGHSYFSTPATLAGYLSLIASAGQLIARSMGLPVAFAALAGLVVAARRYPRTLLLAVPLVALLLGVVLPVRFVRLRFLIIVAFSGCFFAALLLTRLLEWAEMRGGTRAGRTASVVVAWCAVAVVIGTSLVRVFDLTHQMLDDSRYAAAGWLRANARPGDHVGYYGGAGKLPPLEPGVITRFGPWAEVNKTPPGSALPEFIILIPQQPFEVDHEWDLPDSVYAELLDGRRGYRQVLAVQTPSLFPARIISWVNPPVRVFVRQDRLGSLPAAPRIELAR